MNSLVKPWYDDQEKMLEYTTTLEKFYELIHARRNHRKEYGADARLTQYFVRGTWVLDIFGQVSKVIEVKQDNGQQYVDVDISFLYKTNNILTYEQLKETLPIGTSVSYGIGGATTVLPRSNISCARCEEHWNMENTHDVYSVESQKTVSLAPYVGKTLAEVKKYFSEYSNAEYTLHSSLTLKNPKHINLAMRGNIHYDEPINDGGFMTCDSHYKHWVLIDFENYVIEEGDEGLFNVTHYYHQACHAAVLGVALYDSITESMKQAGLKRFGCITIPNEYGSLAYRGPWYVFNTPLGYFKVGWRKRVITFWFCQTLEEIVNPTTPYVHVDDYVQLTERLKQILLEKNNGQDQVSETTGSDRT